MILVGHILACVAIWLILSAAMGLFIGRFIRVGSGT